LHYGEIQPLAPTITGLARGRAGVAWLLADGGFGLPHLPVTLTALDSVAPSRLFDAGVAEEHLVPVSAWVTRNGRAFGEAPEPVIGAYLSVALEEGGFGIMKLLRREELGVHVRLYGGVLDERPTAVDERWLGSVAPRFEHMALTHPSLGRWRPEFLAMAMVEPDELIGYETWKRAKGGFA